MRFTLLLPPEPDVDWFTVSVQLWGELPLLARDVFCERTGSTGFKVLPWKRDVRKTLLPHR